MTYEVAQAGTTVIVMGDERSVSPPCDNGDNGQWWCVSHDTAFANNLQARIHAEDDTKPPHIYVWVCREHGPETTKESGNEGATE